MGANAIEAAKPLLLLGWADVACLAARVAIERRVSRIALGSRRLRRRMPDHPKFYQVCRALRRGRLVDDAWCDATVVLHSALSQVAHGAPIKLIDATRNVELAADQLAVLDAAIQ